MRPEEIINYLKKNIEPLPDMIYGNGYRASVTLVDGTSLPCVIFRNSGNITNLALKRFKEENKSKGLFGKSTSMSYFNIVKHFVTSGNKLNLHDIASVKKSEFAFPTKIHKQIKGETTMGWTGFAAKMKDGKHFGFGTSFLTEFFQMPEGYSVDDIVEIVNHSYVLANGELRSHRQGRETRPDEYKEAVVYRERQYFECFIDSL